MFSIAIGHSNLKVNARWNENVQLWMVLSMKTGKIRKIRLYVTVFFLHYTKIKYMKRIILNTLLGRGKSALHKFFTEVIYRVIEKLERGGLFNAARPGHDIIIPQCTWVNTQFLPPHYILTVSYDITVTIQAVLKRFFE